MNEWQTMLSAVTAVFLVVGAGAFARARDWLTEEADQTLVRLTIWMLYPALILNTMGGNQKLFSTSSIFIAPILGYALPVLGIIVAYLVMKLLGKAMSLETRAEQLTFAVSVGLFNYSYIPVPLAQQLFPNDNATLSSLFLHNAGVDLAIWTIAVPIIKGRRSVSGLPRESLVVLGSIIAGALLNYFHLWDKRPMWLGKSLQMLGDMAIPMSLLLSGAMIADVWKEARFRAAGRTVLAGSIIRMVILPACFIALAMVLPVSTSLKRVLVIQAAMPSAMFSILMGRHFGGDVATAVRIVVATSILALGTIPVWLWIGFRLVGI
jgi:predicted permease